jgi:hypothetical protein
MDRVITTLYKVLFFKLWAVFSCRVEVVNQYEMLTIFNELKITLCTRILEHSSEGGYSN